MGLSHRPSAQAQRIAALRNLARLLDAAFVVPGTSYRIGLDPILGIIPGFGDLISPLFAIAVLWQARDVGVPRVVLLRMVFNVAIDAVAGAVPLLGDLFDVAWKANVRNLALLERHAAGERGPSPGDRLFVALMTLLVAVIAIIPFIVLGWMVAAIGRRLI